MSVFIPQFVKDLQPYLVYNAADGPLKHAFDKHGVLQSVDVDHLRHEWSSKYHIMTSDVYHKFIIEFERCLNVIVALGNHYWDMSRGIFHGHLGRTGSNERFKSCWNKYHNLPLDQGVALVRFSSKKGALAIDQMLSPLSPDSSTHRLLVHVFLKSEKPFCWDSNNKSLFTFSTLRHLMRYVTNHYVNISYIYTPRVISSE
eukprot:TRINITY_DN1354_c0_g1_i1.p1 TRINITY_DN1354_c0_g1~~TRINITY_DN1354_c0_g1_i1.p1  ORF type:complete len:222 (+),score=7.48 TRINITY_DN1354_c0_g1_i1:64-666(+)